MIKSTNQNLLQSFLHLLTTFLTPEYGVRGSGMKNIPRTAAEKRAEEVWRVGIAASLRERRVPDPVCVTHATSVRALVDSLRVIVDAARFF